MSKPEQRWVSGINKIEDALKRDVIIKFGLDDLQLINENINGLNKNNFLHQNKNIWKSNGLSTIKWIVSGICILDFKLTKASDSRPLPRQEFSMTLKKGKLIMEITFIVLKVKMQSFDGKVESKVCGRCKVDLLHIKLFNNTRGGGVKKIKKFKRTKD